MLKAKPEEAVPTADTLELMQQLDKLLGGLGSLGSQRGEVI